MPASPTFVSASIDGAAGIYTEIWSVAVVEGPSPSRTLHGAKRSVAVNAYLSGSGTATLVFALSPVAQVVSSDKLTADVAADSVRSASGGSPNGAVSGAAVANGSTLSRPRTSPAWSPPRGPRHCSPGQPCPGPRPNAST